MKQRYMRAGAVMVALVMASGCLEFDPWSRIATDWRECEQQVVIWTEDGQGGFASQYVPCSSVEEGVSNPEWVRACNHVLPLPEACGAADGGDTGTGDAADGGEDGISNDILGPDVQADTDAVNDGDGVGSCQSQPEICDGLDNDCDGDTDEGLGLSDSTCLQVGVCGAVGATVVAVCNGSSGWVCDYSDVSDFEAGSETTCDGLDNDCDGETDEMVSCDDGDTCTTESCEGAAGCVSEPVYSVDCSCPSLTMSVADWIPRAYGNPSVAVLDGSTLFLAMDSGLAVLDVSLESAPQVVSILPLPPTLSMHKSGDLLMLGSSQELILVDVSTTTMPVVVKTLSVPANGGIASAGGLAFVAGTDGMHVIDVGTPASAYARGQYAAGTAARAPAVWGTYVVVSRPAAVAVVDVSDPDAPAEVGSHSIAGYQAEAIVVDGAVAFVGLGSGIGSLPARIAKFDLSTPTAPAEQANIEVEPGVHSLGSMSLVGSLLVVSAGQHLYWFDTEPMTPSYSGKVGTPLQGSMTISGDRLVTIGPILLATWTIFDLTTGIPAKLVEHNMGGSVAGLAADVDYVAIIDTGEVTVWPAAAAQPSESLPLTGIARSLATSGSTIAVATQASTSQPAILLTFDTSVSGQPAYLDQLTFGDGGAYPLVGARDQLLVVAQADMLRAFDISDATSIGPLGNLKLVSPAVAFRLQDSTAFALTEASTLEIVDISPLGSLSLAGATSLGVVGPNALGLRLPSVLVGADDGTMVVVDASDFGQPQASPESSLAGAVQALEVFPAVTVAATDVDVVGLDPTKSPELAATGTLALPGIHYLARRGNQLIAGAKNWGVYVIDMACSAAQ